MLPRQVVVVADDAVAPVRHRDALQAPVVRLRREAVGAQLYALARSERLASRQRVDEALQYRLGERLLPDRAQRTCQVAADEVGDPERLLGGGARLHDL